MLYESSGDEGELLCIVQLLLARYSRTEDVITLTTVANNLKRPDLDGVLGPFSNTVAIRTDLSGKVCLGILHHSCYPESCCFLPHHGSPLSTGHS